MSVEIEKLFSADEKVVLRHQADKIEIELPGRRFHTETDISHPAGYVGGDRRMREFDMLVTVDAGAIEALLSEGLWRCGAAGRGGPARCPSGAAPGS